MNTMIDSDFIYLRLVELVNLILFKANNIKSENMSAITFLKPETLLLCFFLVIITRMAFNNKLSLLIILLI